MTHNLGSNEKQGLVETGLSRNRAHQDTGPTKKQGVYQETGPAAPHLFTRLL